MQFGRYTYAQSSDEIQVNVEHDFSKKRETVPDMHMASSAERVHWAG